MKKRYVVFILCIVMVLFTPSLMVFAIDKVTIPLKEVHVGDSYTEFLESGECDVDLEEGQILWHLIASPIDSGAVATINGIEGDQKGGENGQGAMHWTFIGSIETAPTWSAIFTSGVLENTELRVSHTCYGGPVIVDPPPVVTPPAIVTPPAVVTPPGVEVTPPAIEVTPPAIEVTPPAIETTPPAVEVIIHKPPRKPPVVVTPPAVTPPAIEIEEPVIIEPEPVLTTENPFTPDDIPQTGGVDPTWLYGLGMLVSAGGIYGLRKK